MPSVKVDREKCIGCGLCPEICPETFEMKGDKAVTKRSKLDKIGCEKEAADSCPTQAIIIS